MGNIAMRCLVHAAPTVRVMRTDGKIVEYDEPVLASKVMKQHADHLVVHCAPTERKNGASGQRRNKLTILRSDQMLELGQAYLLYPIPPQYRSSFLKSQCCTVSEDTEGDAVEEDGRLMKGSFRGLVMRLKIHRKQLLMLSKGARKVRDTREGGDPLLTPPPCHSFQTVESDSEDHSAVFDESGKRIHPANSENMTRVNSPADYISSQV
ncbi:hypothetical protein R1flu_013233 [Riccia fluitans]|uniref:Uncharacterized protein n=1 Tax=Riccia fluitans TaxID=41844 RepID=A0ABD1YCS6_9MARC